MALTGRYLLQGVIATGAGVTTSFPYAPGAAFFASVAGTGAVTASVNVEVTQDPTVGWIVLATIALSGTTLSFNGTTSASLWPFVRGNVTAISGTGATVNLSVYP